MLGKKSGYFSSKGGELWPQKTWNQNNPYFRQGYEFPPAEGMSYNNSTKRKSLGGFEGGEQAAADAEKM